MKNITINDGSITIITDNDDTVIITPNSVSTPNEEFYYDSEEIRFKSKSETNLNRICSLPASSFAPLLIQTRVTEDIDYDWGERPFVRGVREYYEASDGTSFDDYAEALAYEIGWLNTKYKEKTDD